MDLTENELTEEVQKVLSAENRHVPQNLVIYSFKDGGYIPIPKTTNVVTIFESEGTAIHIDSAEAKAQIIRDGGESTTKPHQSAHQWFSPPEMGIDPRKPDLRPSSNAGTGTGTGSTTPDVEREGDETPDGDEEAEEPEGKHSTFLLLVKFCVYL
jgi:dynein intermediate chain 1, axonemal